MVELLVSEGGSVLVPLRPARLPLGMGTGCGRWLRLVVDLEVLLEEILLSSWKCWRVTPRRREAVMRRQITSRISTQRLTERVLKD